jgi:hypothetical protein
VHAVLIVFTFLTPCAANNGIFSDAVDIFNVTANAWSTATLSVARGFHASASLPNSGVVIFAGGCKSSRFVDLSCRGTVCFVRGMHELGECAVLIVCVSCPEQAALQVTPRLWTSSTWLQTLGALHFSA